MIIEKDGKFFEKVEVEKEISELEYLRKRLEQLELQVNSIPRWSPPVICPCPCPKREEPVIQPWTQPDITGPIGYYGPWKVITTCGTTTCQCDVQSSYSL